MFDERFIDREIGELCMEYDKIKGANTNIQRISPSLIDGLKPVQRRALFVMHSPVAIEDAIVNIAQSWHNNIPLIEGQGNFGSIAGDPAGASRYIKARLSDYAYACFFEDWKDSVVDTTLAYDEETKMPDYLPAKYPNVLLNGCLGIG